MCNPIDVRILLVFIVIVSIVDIELWHLRTRSTIVHVCGCDVGTTCIQPDLHNPAVVVVLLGNEPGADWPTLISYRLLYLLFLNFPPIFIVLYFIPLLNRFQLHYCFEKLYNNNVISQNALNLNKNYPKFCNGFVWVISSVISPIKIILFHSSLIAR